MSLFVARTSISCSLYRFLVGGLLLLAVATGAVASPGELDESFGDGEGNGKGWTNFSEYPYTASPDTANASVLQPDGKLVVVGRTCLSYTTTCSRSAMGIVRYNTDGSLDTSFGTQGRATAELFEYNKSPLNGNTAAVALQSDGSIVILGDLRRRSGSNNNVMAVTRLRPNGDVDKSFGTQGIAAMDTMSAGENIGYAMQVMPDDRIVLGGHAIVNSPQYAVARLTANGSLDTTFDGDGYALISFGTAGGANSYGFGRDLTVLGDGKIVMAGAACVAYTPPNCTDWSFGVLRLNVDGSRDTTFDTDGNSDGRVLIPTTATWGTGFVMSMSVDSVGRMLISTNGGLSSPDYKVMRLNADGSPDSTFGVAGKLNPSGIGTVTRTRTLPDGKILLAGGSGTTLQVKRLNSDGSTDVNFGALGVSSAAAAGSALSLQIQNDGAILLAGNVNTGAANNIDFSVTRLTGSGALDSTFNGSGRRTTAFIGTYYNAVNAVVELQDKRIVGGGYMSNGQNTDFALYLLKQNGKRETGFGNSGVITTPIGSLDDFANDMLEQTDGKLVLTGTTFTGQFSRKIALMRYNPNGTLDSAFGQGGIVTTTVNAQVADDANAITQQADGKLVVVGSSYNWLAIVRYNPDGSLDTSFAGSGYRRIQMLDSLGFQTYGMGHDVIQQVDGKLVLVGRVLDGTKGYNTLIARFNPDGSFDTSCDGDGFALIDVNGSNLTDEARRVVQQPDGKLLVAGFSQRDSSYFTVNNAYTIRLNNNCSLDTSFNGNGKKIYAIGQGGDTASGLSLGADNKILVSGTTSDDAGRKDVFVTQLKSDGSIDTSYGTQGNAVVDTDESEDSNTLVKKLDGKLLVAGTRSYTGEPLVVQLQGVDDDQDGIPYSSDNCPSVSNVDQLNTEGDGEGNACDADDDNDGVADADDAFPLDASESVDTDGDGIGNNADTAPNGDNDNDGMANNADPDDDNDGLSDTAELSLGNNPLNNLDPPMVLINAEPVLAGADLIVGLDNHTAGASVFTTSWSSVSGTLFGDGLCANCVAPNINATMTAGGDLCGVNTKGVFCLWWGMDSGTVHGDELLPIQVAGQTYNPLHDWDGYLKYVDQSSVLHNVATDAFKINGDHHTHACIVSKTLGVYCWASHSGSDIISSNIPAALQNVSTIKDVAVGANHACAINNAAVQCWGDATSGKTTVLGAVNAPTQIAAGADHTCAINVNGTVGCWGDNSNGQLGDFDMDGLVDGVSSALNIAAGSNHTCAVTGSYSTPSSLRVTCWGKNNIGQTSVPTSFTNGVDKPVNVTAAGNETCAIKAGQNVAASALVCWPVNVLP